MKRARWYRWPLAAVGMGLLAVCLAACGDQSGGDKLILNEVFTTPGQQWVELYNNSGADLALAGWTLQTPHGPIDLGASAPTTLPASKYLVVAGSQAQFAAYSTAAQLKTTPALIKYTDGSAIGTGLNPDGDVLILTDVPPTQVAAATPAATAAPGGPSVISSITGPQVVDDVSWGTKPAGSATDSFLAQYSTVAWRGLPAPGLTASLGRTPEGTEQDRNPANPGAWLIHTSPSPGSNVPPPTEKFNWFLNGTTNLMTAIGGLLLWIAFIMVGLIARRFQKLSQQRTYWLLLALAPIGIALYLLVVVIGFTQPGGALNNTQKWQGFGVLFLAGVLCLAVISVFRRISRSILETD